LKINKCHAKTKKELECNNFAMKDSKFCYIHTFGKIRSIPFYKNMTFHFIVGILLTIIGIIIPYITGPSKELQTIATNTYELKEDNKIMKDILIKMYNKFDSNEKDFKDFFLKRYPIGYILFYIDSHKKITLPIKEPTNSRLKISWESIQFDLSKDFISLKIPYINYEGIEAKDTILRGNREVLSSFFGDKLPCIFFNNLLFSVSRSVTYLFIEFNISVTFI